MAVKDNRLGVTTNQFSSFTHSFFAMQDQADLRSGGRTFSESSLQRDEVLLLVGRRVVDQFDNRWLGSVSLVHLDSYHHEYPVQDQDGQDEGEGNGIAVQAGTISLNKELKILQFA